MPKHDEFYTPTHIDAQVDALLQARGMPARDLRLAEDLRAILEHEQENVRSLQKVLHQLLRDTSEQPTQKIITLPGRQQQGGTIGVPPQPRPHYTQEARSMLRVWTTLVAVLVVTLLVGSMLLILNVVRQSNAGSTIAGENDRTPTVVARTPTPTILEGQVIYQSERLDLSSPAAWSPDGTRVAAVINRTTVESWDALTGKNVLKYQTAGTIAVSPVGTNSVAWSHDGSTLAVATISRVVLFNARTTQPIRSFSPPQALNERTPAMADMTSLLPDSGSGGIGVEDVAWSPDDKDVSAFTSSGVYIWDAQNGALVTYLSKVYLIHNVNSVRELWQPGGHLLATIECQDAACQTTQVSLWDTTTWSIVKQYPDIYTFDWSPTGNQLALVGAARTSTLIVDALSGQQIKLISDPQTSTITAVRWSPDSSRLVLGTMKSTSSSTVSISIWGVADGKQRYIFPYNDCSEATWSPNSKYVSCVRFEKTGSGSVISSFEQIVIWAA
jgi:WD40 repeat protein